MRNLPIAPTIRFEIPIVENESFRYGVMSYGSEQAIPREVEMQRIIQAIPDNTLKYQRYLELTAKRTNSIAFTIPRGRRCWQIKS